ncbi:MAG: divalent-cation tolerance protein CutA [Nitrospirae bacterium]|nr:divalent-cation tolerance protein CutA [Nitrospirota bacterium]
MADFVDAIVVLITAPPGEAADTISRKILEDKLAACVNQIPQIRSLYGWEGKINDDSEVLLVVKTTRSHFQKLVHVVKSVHPYEVPEIIALPVVDGSDSYLKWIAEATRT